MSALAEHIAGRVLVTASVLPVGLTHALLLHGAVAVITPTVDGPSKELLGAAFDVLYTSLLRGVPVDSSILAVEGCLSGTAGLLAVHTLDTGGRITMFPTTNKSNQ